MTERTQPFSEEDIAEFLQDVTHESGRRVVREDISPEDTEISPYPQKKELREEKILELL